MPRKGLPAAPEGGGSERLPPAIVINLARRADRWAEVSRLLQRFGLAFQRWEATDGGSEDIPEAMVGKWWATGDVKWDERMERWYHEGIDVLVGDSSWMVRLSGGERGCAWSHVRGWVHLLSDRAAVSGGDAMPMMVLEDDVVADAGSWGRIGSVLRAVQDEPPDILYLGWGHWSPWRRVVKRVGGRGTDACTIMEAEYPCTTHAYIIWPSGARKLLECLPVNAPLDHWMAQACSSRRVVSYCVVEGEHSGRAAMPGDGSEGSDPWGGLVRQHRADEPDTGGCGINPTEVMLQHMLSEQGVQGLGVNFPVSLSDLRVLRITPGLERGGV